MAFASDIRAGAAYVELATRDKKLVKGLKRAQARIAAFGANVTNAGRSMLRLSAMAAAPFALGAKVFADFEEQMARVSTMLDEPQKHMTRFRNEIQRLSTEFGESTEALAGGLYDILSASVPAGEALGVLEVATKAAKGGITDTATAADAITTVLNAYNLSAADAASVSDLLFSVVKRGKLTFGDLAPNIGKVATLASAAGISLEELGGTVALLTRVGLKTEVAMTAVSGVINSFLKPSSEGAALASKLGISLDAATLEAEGLHGIFQRIAHLDTNSIAELFPNVRALRGVLPALKNLEGFAGDIDAMQNRAGAADEAFDKMTATMAHGFRQAKQAAVALFVEIGAAVAGPLRSAMSSVKRYVARLRDWIRENQEVVASVARLVVTIGGIGAALIATGLAIKAVAFSFGGLALVLGTVTSAVGAVAGAIGALMSPIGLVAAAVASLAALLVTKLGLAEMAVEKVGGAWGEMKGEAMSSVTAIKNALASGDIGMAAKVFWLQLKAWWERGKASLIGLWEDMWFGMQNVVATVMFKTEEIFARSLAAMKKALIISGAQMSALWETMMTDPDEFWGALGVTLHDYGAMVGLASQRDADKTRRDYYNTEMNAQLRRALLQIDEDERKGVRATNDALAERLKQIEQDRANFEARHRQEISERPMASKAEEELRRAREELARAQRDASRDREQAPQQYEVIRDTWTLQPDSQQSPAAMVERAVDGVMGSFNASLLQRQIGQRTPMEEMAKEQKKTRELSKKQLDAFERTFPNQPAFQ